MRLFACVPLGARITKKACAKRHRETKSGGEKGKLKLGTVTCLRCPVGIDHAKGRTAKAWPDGSPVVEVTVKPLLGQQKLKR